jgi:hypothetical protein
MLFLDWVSRAWTLTIALGVSGVLLIALQSSSLLKQEGWLAKGERESALSKSAPGANPEMIALSFDAVEEKMPKSSLRIDTNGDLVVQTTSEEIRFHKPRVYQELNGARRAIAGGYVFRSPSADEANGQNTGQLGFHIASYDASKPLIIDPVLSYSTYLGGREQDYTHGIAVDAVGNVYVAGQTASSNFPTTANVVQPQINRGPVQSSDAFVLKLNPESNALIYATYLGGTSSDEARSIAVDAAGNAYVTGSTHSTDFPAT